MRVKLHEIVEFKDKTWEGMSFRLFFATIKIRDRVVCAMSLMNWIVRVKFLSRRKKKNVCSSCFFFSFPSFFAKPREKLPRILIKARLKSLDAWCLRFPTRSDFVAVLHDVIRGAPAREIKSGKGFAEAPESETGFPYLQLYVQARYS